MVKIYKEELRQCITTDTQKLTQEEHTKDERGNPNLLALLLSIIIVTLSLTMVCNARTRANRDTKRGFSFFYTITGKQ